MKPYYFRATKTAAVIRTVVLTLSLLLLSPPAIVTYAQTVTTSITNSVSGGPSAPGNLGTVISTSGTTTTITGGTRPNNGGNLFHSFGNFSVGTGDTANFSNTHVNGVLPATSNIISRVTGGNVSNIFGKLQTSGFGSAALWLINPAGVVFGPTAFLNVGGSVHVSTADYLKMTDGASFYANLGKSSQLTSAPVAAFGFLSSNPAPISVQQSQLQVPTGQTLSIIGGDITVTGSGGPVVIGSGGVINPTLSAPGGQINLASVASPGEVLVNTAGGQVTQPTISGFTSLGTIALSQGASLDTSTFGGLNNPMAAGPIFIRGGMLVMDNSSITAISRGYNYSPLKGGISSKQISNI